MSEVGKQLETIDAKIVNGFLIVNTEAVRLKSITHIKVFSYSKTINKKATKVTITYGSHEEDYVVFDIEEGIKVENIILELGVNL